MPPGLAKLLCLTGLLMLAGAITRSGVAAAFADRDPALVLRFASENPMAASKRATQLLASGFTPATLAQAKMLANRATVREPVNVAAVRTLGTIADVQGNSRMGRRIVAASQQLSRRDLIGQLWLIEDAVRQDRVAQALDHYDIALRTSRRAPTILYPVLGAAAEDRELVDAIATLIARKPPWAGSFVLHIASNSRAPVMTAQLFDRVMRQGAAISSLPVHTLIGRLLSNNDVEEAWRLYRRSNSAFSAEAVRDPSFRASLTDPTPFDWSFSSDGGASAMPSVIDGRSVLAVEAPVGTGGIAARQLLVLQAGTAYRLVSIVHSIQAEGAVAPSWRLVCPDDRTIAQLVLPATGSSMTARTPPFRLPDNCQSQRLELVVTATEHPEGVRGVVGSVNVQPVAALQATERIK